jgi:hypothetical protein
LWRQRLRETRYLVNFYSAHYPRCCVSQNELLGATYLIWYSIPVLGAAILFFILHRRHVRKQREEDANDRHASMDFGLGDVPLPGRSKRAPSAMDNKEYGEKPGMSRRQVSMDMAMNSPYLLPPELHNSRESIHSLSRSLAQHEDPYHPVVQYYPGDGASIRSQSKQGSSIYTGSSHAPSRLQDMSTSELVTNAGGMPRSSPPTGFVPPPRQNSLPPKNASGPPESLSNDPVPPYPAEPPKAYMPDVLPSPGMPRMGLPMTPRPGQNPGQHLAPTLPNMEANRESTGDISAIRNSNNYLGSFIHSGAPSPTPSPPRKDYESEPAQQATEQQPIKRKSPPPSLNSLPSNPRPVRKESVPEVQPQTFMDDESEYGDGFKVTPPSPGRENRGHRYSMDVPPEEFAQAGLGAPGFDPKRLSMGFRPLPPDNMMETDDPEIRANRIRSFYKEYFDDNKPAPAGQYYEDYDENYLGESTYYDPDSNQFVMPFAQPVTRRAMTPPPRGPRFQGYQGPPRPRQGSMGAMSTGGMRGPQMYPPGPYPQGPRAYSSASGRMGPGAYNQGPRRPMPPPAALNSLPTPSKLRDDSFALMGAIDFAPPQTYRDRAAGRSESPMGERRPYSPAVPSFAPVVSAFDELAPIPSP